MEQKAPISGTLLTHFRSTMLLGLPSSFHSTKQGVSSNFPASKVITLVKICIKDMISADADLSGVDYCVFTLSLTWFYWKLCILVHMYERLCELAETPVKEHYGELVNQVCKHRSEWQWWAVAAAAAAPCFLTTKLPRKVASASVVHRFLQTAAWLAKKLMTGWKTAQSLMSTLMMIGTVWTPKLTWMPRKVCTVSLSMSVES